MLEGTAIEIATPRGLKNWKLYGNIMDIITKPSGKTSTVIGFIKVHFS